MTEPSTPFATLAEVEAWLGGLTPGGTVEIGAQWFQAPIVQHVFGVVPGSDQLTLTSIIVDPGAGTLSGQAELLEEQCNAALSFTGAGEDPLRLTMSVHFPLGAAWQPLAAFEFTVDGAVAGQASFTLQAASGPLVFTGGFSDGTQTVFAASCTSNAGIQFQDIAAIFGFTLPAIPSDLNLDLTSVAVTYDFGSTALVFGAASANPNYGMVSYVSAPDGTARRHVLVLAANAAIGFADLPLVGPQVAQIGNISLADIKVAIADPVVPADAVAALNDAIAAAGADYPTLPDEGLAEPILLSATLSLGSGLGQPISIALGGTQASASKARSLAGGGGDTLWFDVQKSFGPVSIQKLGLRYADGTLYAVMNAGLESGPVNLGLLGLGAGSPLDSFAPSFTVDAVTLSVDADPVAFSGALAGTIDPVDLYGELGLSLPGLSIGALGGYAQYDGQPSCFLYAVLDAEIGGPPFFFVTGLAAGFGFNRKLVIPDVGSLDSFPLIQWATGAGPDSTPGADVGDQVQQVMQALDQSGAVAPSIGDYWIAAGVQFTSFKLVDSFALLTVAAGNDTEIDLLGLSTITLPPQSSNPIAVAQLALEASFSPAQDAIAVTGQLTPSSWVLSTDCHLTGGFAYCMWYAGAHANEFVLTLGGYSPQFSKPDYYPDVPRLGLNWQVDSSLTVTGDEYFALTPSAVMAGGGLKAVWSGGPVTAWFSVETDFLLLFNPTYYYISVSIDLGASVKVDLFFTSFTVTVHVGVDAQMCGPPFSGTVEVDLDIVSFTIGFGPSPDPPGALAWGDFVDQVLPSRQAQNSLRTGDGAAPVVQIVATSGMVKSLPPVPGAATPLAWLIDGESAVIAVSSTIPVTKFALAATGDVTFERDPDDNGIPNTDIGVAPTGTAPGDFTSTMTVTLGGSTDATVYATLALGGVPKAIWEQRQLVNGVPAGVDPLNDTIVADALTGFTLVPAAPAAQKTLPIPIEYLQYTNVGEPIPLAWSAPEVPASDPFSGQSVHATIADPAASANRAAIIAAIARAGFALDPNPDVEALADPQSGSLLAPPMLRYVVEAC